MPDTMFTVGDGVSRPDNTIRLYNVPGENIIFRNFRGRETQFTRPGDRSFCLIIPNRLFRDQLAAKGCNIKKLKNSDIVPSIEYVRVAVRVTPAENIDDIWGVLDTEAIDQASLEFTFHEYNINGRKHTRIYLRNARFYVKDFNNQYIAIDICWPGNVTCTVDNEIIKNYGNTNNTEETNMEKMTRAEVMGQLQLGITAFEMEENLKRDPVVSKLMCAMKNAIEYIGEVPKSETRVKTVTVERNVKLFPEIKQVIFNGPATVVIWSDDVKTVVKCQEGDIFDREKGISMAICKRLYGNESNFNNLIKKWTEPKTKRAERQAQVEANKTAKGKSKAGKKKALDKARKNDKTMVVLTDAYRTKLRIKMAEKGWTYAQLAEKAGLGKSTVTRLISTAKQKFMPTKIRREVFNKLNNALGIRWKG